MDSHSKIGNTKGFDYSISFIRVTAMLMIVLHHCMCYDAGLWEYGQDTIYGTWGVAFVTGLRYMALYAFMFISGFMYYHILSTTHKYDSMSPFFRRKALRLLVPYAFWAIVMGVILPESSFGSWGHKLLYGYSHLWFLLMLFEVFVIVEIFRRPLQKIGMKCSVAIFVVLFMMAMIVEKFDIIPHASNYSTLLQCGTVISYLPVFYLGMMTEKFRMIERVKLPRPFMILMLVGLFLFTILTFVVSIRLVTLWRWILPFLMLLLAYRLFAYIRNRRICVGGGISRPLQLCDIHFAPYPDFGSVLLFPE